METTSLYSHLAQWGIQTVAMLITAVVLPGLKISGPFSAFLTVVVLALINANLWSAALFFQIPESLSVQVATLMVANSVIFWIVVKVLPGIEIKGLVSALLAPFLFSVSSVLVTKYEKEIDWRQVWKVSTNFVSETREYLQGSDQVEERPSAHNQLPKSPSTKPEKITTTKTP